MYILFYFILQSLLSIYIIIIPKYYLIISIRSHSRKWSYRDWQPLFALVARIYLFCAGTRDSRIASYWIDTLVLKTEGNTYATLLHHPFLFGENQRNAQEVAGMLLDSSEQFFIFGRRSWKPSHGACYHSNSSGAIARLWDFHGWLYTFLQPLWLSRCQEVGVHQSLTNWEEYALPMLPLEHCVGFPRRGRDDAAK